MDASQNRSAFWYPQFVASLDFVRYKVKWAERHRQFLNAEIRRYFEQSIPQIIVEVRPRYFGFDEISANGPNIPLEVPLIIGDCLQNLRSSLDYLVWELCVAANVQPTDKNQFPICDAPNKYRDVKGQQLAGVPILAQTEIENLQPFKVGGSAFIWHELWILNRLTNISKHRRILHTDLGAVRTEKATGAAVAPSQVNQPFKGEMELDYDPVALIKCGESEGAGEEVSALLRRLSDYITLQVIPKFETFFP
jgi:hypothetical protein